ncbi:hypothetical protein H9P43_005228 [Blastocladiella emersonii ATCC 22665]|nr:hypothetical protein H9P43_005228 [Blastocladiella emersonii ATCC 22665]
MGLLVYSWGPLEGPALRPLPSCDPACLSAITFLSLCKASFSVQETNDAALSETGALPVLRDDTSMYHGLAAVLARKSDRASMLDMTLGPERLADARALRALLDDKLNDILAYAWFVHPENAKTTADRFRPLLSLVPRWIHTRRVRRRVVARLNERRDWSSMLLTPDRPTVRLTSSAAVGPTPVSSAAETARTRSSSASSGSTPSRRRVSDASTNASTVGVGTRTPVALPAVREDGVIDEEDILLPAPSVVSATSTGITPDASLPNQRSVNGKPMAQPGTFKPPSISLEDDECTWSLDEILGLARYVYGTLASYLADNEFMAGEVPTSVDAVVFGHLALHYYPILAGDSADETPVAEAETPVRGIPAPAPLGPRSLASLLRTEFPSLVTYLDRVYRVARIADIHVERDLPPFTTAVADSVRGAVTAARTAVASSRSSVSRDTVQSIAAIGAGIAMLAAYVVVVRGGEERRVAQAIEHARSVQRDRARAQQMAQRQGQHVEEEEEVERYEEEDEEDYDDDDDDDEDFDDDDE